MYLTEDATDYFEIRFEKLRILSELFIQIHVLIRRLNTHDSLQFCYFYNTNSLDNTNNRSFQLLFLTCDSELLLFQEYLLKDLRQSLHILFLFELLQHTHNILESTCFLLDCFK